VLLPCGTGWMALADCKEECHPCNWPSEGGFHHI